MTIISATPSLAGQGPFDRLAGIAGALGERPVTSEVMTGPVSPLATAALDQARSYLAKVIAWPESGEAYVNLHWSEVKLGNDRPIWSSRACRSLDETMRALTWIRALPGKREIYVCLSSQRLAEDKTSKNGNKYRAAIRGQHNVVALKSIYLDIDVKGLDKNSYTDLGEAIEALIKFLKDSCMPKPTVIVRSGGGLHVYWTMARALTREEWQPLAYALAEATKQLGLKCDTQCTIDSARVLRVPDTNNYKTDPPRPVTLAGKKLELDYDPDRLWQALVPYKVALPASQSREPMLDPLLFPPRTALTGLSELSAGINKRDCTPVHLEDLTKECGFIREAVTTGGEKFSNPMWNLTTLIATFTDDARNDAHRMGNKYPGYTKANTDEFFDRKLREKAEKGLGVPSCATISSTGCTACQTCSHFANRRSPLAALPLKVTTQLAPDSYADPYSEFVGPSFPTSILPPALADFVEAEHKAMGADLSALAMAALAGVGAALTSETKVKVGDGWYERPIFFVAIIGDPSTMKSPVIAKATKALSKIDHDRDAAWRIQKSLWDQQKAAGNKTLGPYPAKPARCIIQDTTPEKTAEILARGSAGALMVQDELAGWMASFDRYGSGAPSRAFYLTAFNGGPYLKDRVGQGVRDENAEIRVENLALCILGGIQPDRLAELRGLTSDGLLQRFLVVLIAPAKRGNQKHPVAAEEGLYEKLIQSVHSASPCIYHFATDAEPVLNRVLDHLYELEQVQGFSSALIGAIGKYKGYFARIALTLEVAAEHSATIQGQLAASGNIISKQTAEAAEQLLFKFLLPHTFGLYDVVANGGQDRDTTRAIGDFILASDKDRLRPSDFTAGVRRLRSQPANKIAEWASRFCALGWIRPEDERATVPKAWSVDPGLRTYFAARRRHAQAARAAAHDILKAGGTR
jgi:hypothetical protein